MTTLRRHIWIFIFFWISAGIQTFQASENVDVSMSKLEQFEKKLKELEHELKSLEEAFQRPDKVTSDDREEKQNNNEAKEFQLTYEKRSNLPNPAVPAEESDPELEQFEQQLTPEQQQLLKKMKDKLKYLQAVLHEPKPEHSADAEIPVPEIQVDNRKRSNLPEPQVPAEESDVELQKFEQNLTPEQQELLKKMHNKVKYLQAVLHEPRPAPEEESPAEVQVMQKKTEGGEEVKESADDDQALLDYIAHLSPEQQALIQRNKNKLPLLKAVLSEQVHSSDPEEEESEVTEKKKEFNDDDENEKALDKEAVTFTTADRMLLQEVNKKLNELKKSLETFRKTFMEKQQPAADKTKDDIENKAASTEVDGEFGDFVQVRRKRGRDSEWHDSPVKDNNLGLVEKKCQACDCGNKQCDCEACSLSDSNDVSKRVLAGLKSGDTSPVNLKQLLNTLSRLRGTLKQ